MNLSTLKSLQARIREATRADRDLDAQICAALRWGPHNVLHSFVFKFPTWRGRSDGRVEVVNSIDGAVVGHFKSPELTSDPDGLGACVGLCREVLPGWGIEQITWEHEPNGKCIATIGNYGEGDKYLCGGTLNPTTPPLAVLDAICAALIAEEEAKEKADV